MDWKGKHILITGGTGTLGKALVRRFYNQAHITVLARNEEKIVEMRRVFPAVTYRAGNIRDPFTLRNVVANQDIVIHAAAMKHIPIAEENVRQCAMVNVLGTVNVIDACKEAKTPIVVGISTDKAQYAKNVYGATKLILEGLFREAGKNFLVVRYGNVAASSGSVIRIWKDAVKNGKPLTVTHPEMRRFFFTLEEAVDLIEETIEKEIPFNFRPMKVVRLQRMAELIADGKVAIVYDTVRKGEKLDETLVADYEGEEVTTKNSPEMTDAEILDLIASYEN